MANPTASSLHVDALLTNVSIGYKNPAYIADQIFPVVPVMKQSDIVPNYEQSHWFRNEAKPRAPGTKSARGGFKVANTDTYFCHQKSFGFEIPDQVRANADAPYNVDRDGAEFATDKLLMAREVGFATDFFTTSVWANDDTGGVEFTVFSDYGSSTPLSTLYGYMDEIEGRIGREGNSLVMGKEVWNQLKWHPDVIDLIKYTQKGIIGPELFASMLELNKLLIGRGIRTTSPEGTAEASVTYSRIWGKHVLVAYITDRPSLMNPSAGYTFVWQVVPSALQYIKRMRDEERETDIIEVNSYFDQKATATRAGTFLSGAVA